jgi:hypothetical protein
MRPSFSDETNESFYSFPQAKPKYITTERYFPSVEKQYNINAMKKADRDLLFTFWNDKLSYGQNMFTLIDHRQRCLFNALWDTFGAPESWQANRNAHSLTMKIQNPFGWTLPLHGAFLFGNNVLTEYLGTGVNISTSSGSLVTHAVDSSVLRENGSALKLVNTGGTFDVQIGAEAYPVWKSTTGKTSISLFCQVYFSAQNFKSYIYPQTTEAFVVIRLTNGTTSIGISCAASDDLSNVHLEGFIRTSAGVGGVAMIEKTGAIPAYIKCPNWYDLAITYDETTNQVAVYYTPCATVFTDFLNGETSIEGASDFTTVHGGILSTPSRSIPTLTDITWTDMLMLEENLPNMLNNPIYMQNILVCDSFMTAIDFNFMRRLCHYWNAQTTGVWPK